MAQVFGPVPVSQLKPEAPAVFKALDAGRTVLVSRHGTVVAQIDPPDWDSDRDDLASFALTGHAEGYDELNATEIRQGSPSRAVHAAEAGTPALVTKDHHVVGFLRPRTVTWSMQDPAWMEDQVAAYEQSHPDATAEELSDLMDSLQEAPVIPPLVDLQGGHEVPVLARHTLAAAWETRLVAYANVGRVADAERVYHHLLADLGATHDDHLNLTMGRAMVAMGRAYVADGRTEDALTATTEAAQLLTPLAEKDGPRTPA